MQSLDRLTWFTEQYDEASDEKFFSKSKVALASFYAVSNFD